MSLYSFTAANLTTEADHKRRPAVSKAQVARTLVLCALFLFAATVTARRGEVAKTDFHGPTSESGFHGFVDAARA